MVVAVDGRDHPVSGPQVLPRRAQVARGRQRRVIDVLRVGRRMARRGFLVFAPRCGQELHRPDGAVVGRVAVKRTAVGICDQGDAVLAIQ